MSGFRGGGGVGTGVGGHGHGQLLVRKGEFLFLDIGAELTSRVEELEDSGVSGVLLSQLVMVFIELMVREGATRMVLVVKMFLGDKELLLLLDDGRVLFAFFKSFFCFILSSRSSESRLLL